MGQNDSKQIQQAVSHLQNGKVIQHFQAQKFLHDYHNNDAGIQDVKNFEENRLNMFLKYFILKRYPQRHLDKQVSKRVKTNQSTLSQEDKGFDNLVGLMCFETFRNEQKFEKLCILINKCVLNYSTSGASDYVQQMFALFSIKDCQYIVCNKNNVQQLYCSFSRKGDFILTKRSKIKQNSFPRSLKYRFRRLKRSQVIDQKYLMDQNSLQSEQFYIQENSNIQKSSVLLISFQETESKDSKKVSKHTQHIVQRFMTEIGEFISKVTEFVWHQENLSKKLACQQENQILHKSFHQRQDIKHLTAYMCWNFFKIYKSDFQFQHSCLIERIKVQYNKLLNLNSADNSLQQIKAKINDYFVSENNSDEQQSGELQTYFTHYENKQLEIKNSLSEYLQKSFEAITSSVVQLYFDQDTQLKIVISSQSQNSVVENIRAIQRKGNNPTLFDIFKGQTAFQQFYRNSYQQIRKDQSEKVFQHEGILLQFRMSNGTLSKIKISISEDFFEAHNNSVQIRIKPAKKTLQKIDKKTQKKVPQESQKKLSQKKKFSDCHNSSQQPLMNKQNMHYQKPQNMLAKQIGVLKVKRTSQRNISVLDLTSIQSGMGFDIYSSDLNILEIEQSKYVSLAHTILFQLDYFKNLQIKSCQKIVNFLQQLRDGYQEHGNPFHNFAHGVNVMHTAFLLSTLTKQSYILSDFARFALILSALCHDVGHTGYNNAFEIATNSPLSQAFNDISPLQNYHISRTLQILRNQQNNFLDFMNGEQKTKLRRLLISNILNTDMKEHFNVLRKFEEKKLNFEKDDIENQKIISGMLIHSSDFGGSIKQFHICQQWSRRVNEQFKHQSKKQAQLGLPLSPFMLNLENQLTLAKNQLGFLKFMVQPLYRSISQLCPQKKICQGMVRRLNQNIQKWQITIQRLKA